MEINLIIYVVIAFALGLTVGFLIETPKNQMVLKQQRRERAELEEKIKRLKEQRNRLVKFRPGTP